ncbi:YraN family protein [Roseivivax sp. CAU 1761]
MLRAERVEAGGRAELSGRAAEAAVAAEYARRGHPVAARRWRGAGGEIDLVVSDGDGLIFVEVKRAASFARAAERLSDRQMRRLGAAAAEYLAGMPRGALTPARFDAALVDGQGAVRLVENAFGL